MPAAFDNCVKQGGKVRTVTGPNKQMGLQKGEYMHICMMGGEMYKGYKKKGDKDGSRSNSS